MRVDARPGHWLAAGKTAPRTLLSCMRDSVPVCPLHLELELRSHAHTLRCKQCCCKQCWPLEAAWKFAELGSAWRLAGLQAAA